jgi:malonyl-CoA O-methyltransferase
MNLPPTHIDKNQIIKSFNRAAPTYEQWSKLQKMVGENLLERLEWLKFEPQHILEVGAGIGRLSRALSQQYQNAEVYSIDISITMAQIAHQKAFNEVAQPHFICADGAQLPMADNSIDLLMSNLMLQWCNDIQTIFAEFARVLKPDGALFFSTFGPDTLTELRHSFAQVDDAIHLNQFLDIHDIGDTLLQVGLTNPVMDVDWFQFTYNDVKQLMLELKHIGAHNMTTGRPRGLMGKDKFRAMLTAYEQYRLPDDSIPATYEIVYGHARGLKKTELQTPHTVTIPISQLKKTM